MAEDPFEQAEAVEKNSTTVIVIISLVAIALLFSGVVTAVAGALNLNEGVVIFLYAAVVNLGLVLYQVNVGKVINRLCQRPYI